MKQTKTLFKIVVALAVLCILGAPVIYAELYSEYDSGTSSAAVTFGPGTGVTVVKAVSATTDKEDGAVKIYTRGGSGKTAATSAAAASATHIPLTNTGLGLNTNDTMVIVHNTGNVEYRTVSGYTSTTNITLNSGLTYALTTSDYIYEVSQDFEIVVGFDGAGSGTNDSVNLTGDIYASPSDSPVYVVLDGTGTAKLGVTIDK